MQNPNKRVKSFSLVAERYATVFAYVILFVFFSFLAPGFFTAYNVINLLRQISMLAIVTCGLTICIIAGDWDLSIGRVAGLAGIVAVSLITSGMPTYIGIIAALAVGILIGCVNGLLITKVGIPSLIVTLGMMSVCSGISLTWTRGLAIYKTLPDNFTFWGSGYIGSIPTPIYIMVI
ncbi:ABC transporter permease, partial [Candidatus Aerophobetes bacterium]|nr:ABC transporter permease [Candidatus Aerophobetes bacterium]